MIFNLYSPWNPKMCNTKTGVFIPLSQQTGDNSHRLNCILLSLTFEQLN